MEQSIGESYFRRANLWLFLAVAAYFAMNGAQLWETAIMVPAWTQAPPASLIFFREPYGLDFKVFWIVVHSVHELFLITALVFNWQIQSRRNLMLLLLAVHVAVRAWTLLYFAPTLIEFQGIQYSDTVDSVLTQRAAMWRDLNYLRVGLFVAVNLGFAALLRVGKPVRRKTYSKTLLPHQHS